jgi:hypothetical protein
VRRAVRDSGEPFKRVLNDALRAGLRAPERRRRKPFVQATAHMGRELVDLTKSLALAGELEDRAAMAKLRTGR